MSYPPLPPAEPRPSRAPMAFAVGFVVFALLVAGLGGWWLLDQNFGDDRTEETSRLVPVDGQDGPMPPTPAALAKYYDQELAWAECGGDECAELRVPLDYADPDGAEIEIAVLRSRARAEKSLGALVVNPGGPGASGVRLAMGGSGQFGRELTRFYDIVGFDPRGVGASQPLRCLSTEQLDAYAAFDPDPDSPAEVAELDALLRAFGQGCLDRSGDLARHMSTQEVARDMDVLRAALGQPRLDYLGYSYGTLLGATYADEFPGNVGRFVLDGAIDPSLSNAELSLQQGNGFETALRAYLRDCVEDGDCFLGDTVDQGADRIRRFLDRLDSQPIAGAEGRPLTEGLATYGIWLPLYAPPLWPTLTAALEDAMTEEDGAGLLRLADLYTSRGEDGYEDNSLEALLAVNCLDHSDSLPGKDVLAAVPRFEKASPTFGRAFAYALSTCASWPVKSGQRTVALRAEGAPPIVVIGTTRDPATPLAWAQAMAEQLESGRLITRDGDGHTGFRQGSACVDDAVESFLVEGKVPADDLRCS